MHDLKLFRFCLANKFLALYYVQFNSKLRRKKCFSEFFLFIGINTNFKKFIIITHFV